MLSQLPTSAKSVAINFTEAKRVLVQDNPGPVRVCVRAPKRQDHKHFDAHKINSETHIDEILQVFSKVLNSELVTLLLSF